MGCSYTILKACVLGKKKEKKKKKKKPNRFHIQSNVKFYGM